MRRVSWGAIFAGAVVAVAVMIMLAMLGLGIGAATIDPLAGEGSVQGKATGSAVFVVISQLIALGVGGFIASKMAGVPRTLPSAIHGVAVWAVSTIVMIWLATSAAGSIVGSGAAMIGSASSAVARAGAAIVPEDLSLPELSLSSLSIDDFPEPVQQAMRERGVTPENFDEKAKTALNQVVSEAEADRARRALMTAVRETLANPGQAKAQAEQLSQSLREPGGLLSEQNKRQALTALEQQFGVSPDEAQAAYDKLVDRADQAVQSAQQTAAQARQKSLELADQAARAVSAAGFAAFFASLLALVAAIGGALAGRPQTLIGAEAGDLIRS